MYILVIKIIDMQRVNRVWSFVTESGERVEALTLDAILFLYSASKQPSSEHHNDMRADYKPINW